MHAVAARPLLVPPDGHSSHYQPDLIRVAREHDILFVSPPTSHTTYESQPLDPSVFKPMKQNRQDACCEYKAVRKYLFTELFLLVWDKTMTLAVIYAGLRYCGV